jgi:hypothetical protein
MLRKADKSVVPTIIFGVSKWQDRIGIAATGYALAYKRWPCASSISVSRQVLYGTSHRDLL